MPLDGRLLAGTPDAGAPVRPVGRFDDVSLENWGEAAAYMGDSYLRYAHTRSTHREAELLIDRLRIGPGDRVADVGCGPGRHAHVLREAGVEVIGIDIAPAFARLTGPPVAVADAHVVPIATASLDAVYAIQLGEADELVLTELARVLRPGGRLLLTAFNAHYARRYAGLPPDTDRNVEHATVHDAAGNEAPFTLTYRCVTPHALQGLVRAAGLDVDVVWSVEPGSYAPNDLSDDRPELLLVGGKPPL